MDQGWAAVIAAGVAAVVAVAASFIGVWLGRRTVRDQAQVEHGQWLRNQRQEAYVAVLDTWDVAMSAFEAIIDGSEERKGAHTWATENVGGNPFLSTVLFGEVDQHSGPVNEALERVRLLGPDPVERAAKNLEDALKGLGGAIRANSGEEELQDWPNHAFWNEARRNASECRREFFRLARSEIRTAPSTGEVAR
ncbi:hypothetical protein ACFWV1_25810 [Streptomyces sp. NPDC058700]|uniref:hypothetical protein n=1 Tax=Streptomyces sp. NPDC058700 TaxID=3346607 RepID=UPI00365011E3